MQRTIIKDIARKTTFDKTAIMQSAELAYGLLKTKKLNAKTYLNGSTRKVKAA